MTIEIRRYRTGDEEAIVRLFSEAHGGREMTLSEWNWRYRDNPAGPGYIMLAWDDGRLVSHYATMSRLILWDGTPTRTELSVNTMTAPSHRGQRLFQRLAEATYADISADGIAAVWGFPNSMSHRIFLRDLQWHNIGVLPFLRLSFSGEPSEASASFGAVEIQRDDPRLDAFWRRCAVQLKTVGTGVADGRYFKWRFSDARGETYRLLALAGADGALDAVAVWKRYRDEAQVMLLLAADPQASKPMLEELIAQSRRLGHRAITLWCGLDDPVHLELERLGFLLDAPVTYLGWRALRAPSACDVRFKRLALQLHDSDIF